MEEWNLMRGYNRYHRTVNTKNKINPIDKTKLVDLTRNYELLQK